ncbi:hypothetical protein PR048_010140 [Dryococelus australis]|uniref:Uncharacterized protein n=1 Tax=Dryococelus australis TaxID=614101 RepID=A0ABQ9I2N7_9NEOP|nr:hypothetical protein PR048_010140 [Dryococelus australis]
MWVMVVSVERSQYKGAGEMGNPRENPVRRGGRVSHDAVTSTGFDIARVTRAFLHVGKAADVDWQFFSGQLLFLSSPRSASLLRHLYYVVTTIVAEDSRCAAAKYTLAFHQGEPGSIPGRVTGISQVGIVPNDAVGQRVFSGISRFPASSFRLDSATLHFLILHRLHSVCKAADAISTPPGSAEGEERKSQRGVAVLCKPRRDRRWRHDSGEIEEKGHHRAATRRQPRIRGGAPSREIYPPRPSPAHSHQRAPFGDEIWGERFVNLPLARSPKPALRLSPPSKIFFADVARRAEVTCGSSRHRDPPNVLHALLHTATTKSFERVSPPARRFELRRRVFEIRCSSIRKPGRLLAESIPDFRVWESCLTMPLVDRFSRYLPFSPPFHSGTVPMHLAPPSSALKTLLLRAAQISSPTHSVGLRHWQTC